jgi:hypothetical protein
MRFHTAAICVLLAGMLIWGSRNSVATRTQSSQVVAAREPVVVELFTSEGCSSCPPADALLADLDVRQPLRSVDIIAIEEHVDYWDQDGWLDPFSSAAWTTRQKDYSDVLRTGGSYTPEMVVDGNTGFVGSRGAVAVQEIEKAAMGRKAKVEIAEVSPAGGKTAEFKVNVEKFTGITPKDKAEVLLAITESGLHSAVKAGENAGQELHHSPVLREMKVIGVAGKNGQETFTAEPSVKLDSHWKVENLRAVAFVQERKSRRILGAAEIHLTP